ncbi:hypothetical protein R1flu_007370 [Riccia fluitans]|uniref:RWP-RK domain-containing protein n=1 Tax=Riccia fluitans TaxID=41844 RepID=A0ABD1YYR5_9MARC
MGSTSLRASAFPAASASCSLHAVIVFQHLQNIEIIKSVHVYAENGSVTAIQQEFLLSPGAYAQISEPQPFCVSKFHPAGVEQFMGTLKRLTELEQWQCILEFSAKAPLATTLIPLLSVTRNPQLRALPNLAIDLIQVEKAILREAQCFGPRQPRSPRQEQERLPAGTRGSPEEARSWHPLKWMPSSSAMSTSTVHSAESSDTREDGLGDGSSLQIETLHEWGSDLELASPRMFDSCILGSTWSTSISSVPFTALMSTLSPTSSLINSHKTACSSWSSPNLGLNSLSGTFDYHVDSSSSQSNFGPGRISLKNDLPSPGGNLSSCHADPVPMGVNTELSYKSRSSPPLRKVVERTRSHCSDESVCTPPLPNERQGSGFSLRSLPPQATKLRLTDRSQDLSPQETSSSRLTETSLSRKDGVTTRNMLEKVSGTSTHHHRGPTERMTEITLSELSSYFNMPITQASKELKVGLTVLKKRCREFGIPRWPHRKMKSLDSLIQNIQELAKGPEGKTSAPVMNAVKELEHQKKRMEERPGIELAERTKRLRQACFKASYKKRRQAQTLAQQESYEVSGAVPVDQCVSTLVS